MDGYTHVSQVYDLVYRERTTDTGFYRAAVDRAAEQGARRVLEIGAGTGRVLLPIASAHPEVSFTALDLDTDVDTELAGAFAEQPLELLLRQRQGVHRGLGQLGEVHMDTAERESRSRNRVGAGRCEPIQQAAVAQQFQDLPAEPAGLRGVRGRGCRPSTSGRTPVRPHAFHYLHSGRFRPRREVGDLGGGDPDEIRCRLRARHFLSGLCWSGADE